MNLTKIKAAVRWMCADARAATSGEAWRMIVTILRPVIDPTLAARGQIRRYMQVMTQPGLQLVRRDAHSVRCCINPGHLAPIAQETEA